MEHSAQQAEQQVQPDLLQALLRLQAHCFLHTCFTHWLLYRQALMRNTTSRHSMRGSANLLRTHQATHMSYNQHLCSFSVCTYLFVCLGSAALPQPVVACEQNRQMQMLDWQQGIMYRHMEPSLSSSAQEQTWQDATATWRGCRRCCSLRFSRPKAESFQG